MLDTLSGVQRPLKKGSTNVVTAVATKSASWMRELKKVEALEQEYHTLLIRAGLAKPSTSPNHEAMSFRCLRERGAFLKNRIEQGFMTEAERLQVMGESSLERPTSLFQS